MTDITLGNVSNLESLSTIKILNNNNAAITAAFATLGGATGTVTSITVTQPAAGFTVTNSGVAATTVGTFTFALSNDLAAVEGLATTGIVRRTATDTWSAGTLVSLTTEVTGALPNGNLANSSVTIGSTAVSLGATVTTFTGLTALTSTTLSDGIGNVRVAPQNNQNANYTLVAGDSGKCVGKNNGTAYTHTIPANSSVAYTIGTMITFYNDNATNNLSIAITTDTMYLAGSTTTGTRTLAPRGIATAIKIASTVWYISGSGLT